MWWIGILLMTFFAMPLVLLAVYDLIQRKHAILKNFPVIGHFRYWVETIGPELRRYIVTDNNEERPFSRDERRCSLYASSKRENNYFGFGSDNEMELVPNYLIIKHSAFPITPPNPGDPDYDPEFRIPCAKVLGEHRRRAKSFRPGSVVNISGMSYGSISGRAVEALNRGWITGFYWTLTVMSTLGFGDITFHTDLGRLFSIVVLLSGMIFMLVLLPFTFIEFFYEPWMKAQAEARAPRQLPAEMRGHVLLTSYDPVTSALIDRLEQYEYPYATLVPNVDDALILHDLGLNVMVGDLDDPDTWRAARVQEAALVASTASDVTNTNVAFAVRGLAKDLPIITSARDEASVDILKLAGSSYVLCLEEMIGQSFAWRMLGGDAKSHVIGKFDQLLIAEATAHRTPLVGKTLREAQLRQNLGVTVVGVWERGRFEPARAETEINDNTVLVLAGSKEDMFRYDEFFCIYNVSAEPVVILGGSVVGIRTERGVEVVPNPTETLPADVDIVLIGTADAEECFLELYRKGRATNG